ncbi:right-handed parallel beta-helix repeat-containing protein [Agromyces sp. GXS1127]|uniref:right-handed parallel beta-helix repeat-containing protein n=1 Tax=Agromyces sp. GXS1127 TaxID=3424181 RepID=UPI003D318C87
MNDLRTTHEDRRHPWQRHPLAFAALIVAAVLALGAGATAIAWAVQQDDAPADDASAPRSDARDDATPDADAEPGDCPDPDVTVGDAAALQDALDGAQPGEVILVEAGRYVGEFTASAQGTAEEPVTLCGTHESVLDGGGIDQGYVLHLDGVSHWTVQGLALENGQKGLMADGATHTEIRGLSVSKIGDEAIHLRAASTDNLVTGNVVSDTGQRKPKFGEGIYVGTAESNWCDISDCEPDPSDRNVIEGNEISRTTAESIDIKEGTSEGIVRDNTFDGASLVIDDADSWVDVKGNDWLIEGNSGVSSAADGFQTHEILDGWGTRNVFRDNTAALDGAGLGFALKPARENVLECSNEVSGPGAELSNVECRD